MDLWLTGAVLGALLLGAVLAGAHAGGHHLALPLPALVLAVAWLVVATGEGVGTAAWGLAAASVVSAAGGIAVALPAVRFRHQLARMGTANLKGASGYAVNELAPRGVIKVAGETWSAESLSGRVPAGAPVHVVGLEGLRLKVWSEAGTVPGPEVLESVETRRERP